MSTASACGATANTNALLSTLIGRFQSAPGQYNTGRTKGTNFLLELATGYDFMSFDRRCHTEGRPPEQADRTLM
jgi:hypothetical protein